MKTKKLLGLATLATLPLAAGIITPVMMNNSTSNNEVVTIQEASPSYASTYIGAYNKTTWVESDSEWIPETENLVNINLNVIDADLNTEGSDDYTVWFSLEGTVDSFVSMQNDILADNIDFNTTGLVDGFDGTENAQIYYVDGFGNIYSLDSTNSKWIDTTTDTETSEMMGQVILDKDSDLGFSVTDTTVTFEMSRSAEYEKPEEWIPSEGDNTSIDAFPTATVDLAALTTPVVYADNSTTVALATTFTVIGGTIILLGGWWAYKKYFKNK